MGSLFLPLMGFINELVMVGPRGLREIIRFFAGLGSAVSWVGTMMALMVNLRGNYWRLIGN